MCKNMMVFKALNITNMLVKKCIKLKILVMYMNKNMKQLVIYMIIYANIYNLKTKYVYMMIDYMQITINQ